MTAATSAPTPLSTGIPGLDAILRGGFPPHRLYLVEGDPGVGKTTLALQFLLDGVARGEPGLYVTLSETAEELRAVAASHGWSLDGLEIHELSSEEQLGGDTENSLFHPSEVELAETTKSILSRVEATRPRRVVFDSLSEMRLLAQSALRYRRQILALKQYFVGRDCTVLLMDDRTSEVGDPQLQSIVHGVVELQLRAGEYGAERRRLLVRKLRGVGYQGGYHDYVIRAGGMTVFPRVVADGGERDLPLAEVKSGLGPLDDLLGGGPAQGSSVLLIGPAGCAKSSIAVQYVYAAAQRGEGSAVFCFEESTRTLLARSRGLGTPLEEHVASGLVHLKQVNPAELSPGEFSALVKRRVEDGARVIVIDSLNGYMHAMPEAQFLSAQLHELLGYLGERGVLTLLVVAQHGVLGAAMASPIDVSYLADTVLLFRFFELDGEVRKAISIVKRREGAHEATIRELRQGNGAIHIGEPLRGFRGLLTGVPVTLDRSADARNDGDGRTSAA